MEPLFGMDFSQVRVHDATADRARADRIGALAFTDSNHIYLGTGARGTDRQLMAHELTHVVQQGAARPVEATNSSIAVSGQTAPKQQLQDVGRVGRTASEVATQRIPDALRWLNTVVNTLDSIISSLAQLTATMRSVGSRTPVHHETTFTEVFRIERGTLSISSVQRVLSVYRGIVGTLGSPPPFVNSPAIGEFEGAPAYLPNPPDGRIHFTPLYLLPESTEHRQTEILIHEGAHFQDPPDYSQGHAGISEGVRPDRYATFEHRLRNAYAYSAFAALVNGVMPGRYPGDSE
jgi:hypothetical protein